MKTRIRTVQGYKQTRFYPEYYREPIKILFWTIPGKWKGFKELYMSEAYEEMMLVSYETLEEAQEHIDKAVFEENTTYTNYSD